MGSTYTIPGATDNGDGSWSSSAVSDNGDGTWTDYSMGGGVVPVSLTLNARRPDGSVFPEGALVTVKYDRTVSASDLVVPDPAAVPVVVTQGADPVLEVPYASDDPAVDPASQGFGLIVTARWVQDGTPQSWTRTYGLTLADGDTPNLSSLGLLVAASTPNLVQGPRGPAGPGNTNPDIAGYISTPGATQSALNAQVDAHLGGDSTGLVPIVQGKVTQRPERVDIRDAAPTVDLSGVIDAVAALQAAWNALPPDATFVVPPGATVAVASGPVVANQPINLDARGATFTTGSSATGNAIQVNPGASGSTFTGMRMQGGWPTTYKGNHRAFNLIGTPTAWVDRIRFVDVTVDGYGAGAFYGTNVSNISFRDPTVSNCVYYGIQLLSAVGVDVWNPTISNIPGYLTAGHMQSYPIAFTRDQTQASITDYPRSSDCTVWGGSITGCPWEAIDSHGGQNIKVVGTTIRGAMYPISMVPCPNTSGADTYAPRDITIAFCDIDSMVDDGSLGSGIRIVGASAGIGATVEPATGTVYGCRIARQGYGVLPGGGSADPSTVAAGVQMYATSGMTVAGNRIIECNPFGVSLWYDNQSCYVGDNHIVDPWSATFTTPAAVAIRSTGNSMILGAARLKAGTKSATYVNKAGLYISSNTNNTITYAGGHDFTAATIPISGGSGTTRISLSNKPAQAPPTLTSSSTAAQIVAALQAIGIAQ